MSIYVFSSNQDFVWNGKELPKGVYYTANAEFLRKAQRSFKVEKVANDKRGVPKDATDWDAIDFAAEAVEVEDVPDVVEVTDKDVVAPSSPEPEADSSETEEEIKVEDLEAEVDSILEEAEEPIPPVEITETDLEEHLDE